MFATMYVVFSAQTRNMLGTTYVVGPIPPFWPSTLLNITFAASALSPYELDRHEAGCGLHAPCARTRLAWGDCVHSKHVADIVRHAAPA